MAIRVKYSVIFIMNDRRFLEVTIIHLQTFNLFDDEPLGGGGVGGAEGDEVGAGGVLGN